MAYSPADGVRPVLSTVDRVCVERACEELREHNIKCDLNEPSLPDLRAGSSTGVRAPLQVVVAPEDEDRAKEVLRAWLLFLASADPS